jgi:hypothetical protein
MPLTDPTFASAVELLRLYRARNVAVSCAAPGGRAIVGVVIGAEISSSAPRFARTGSSSDAGIAGRGESTYRLRSPNWPMKPTAAFGPPTIGT